MNTVRPQAAAVKAKAMLPRYPAVGPVMKLHASDVACRSDESRPGVPVA